MKISEIFSKRGVSATHLDWTMVPYVRKSFLKHYKDGLKYIDSHVKNMEITCDVSSDQVINISIDNRDVYTYDLSYKYAMDMTEKEIKQATEGMFHNLNTLQSRSGNQLPFTSINYGTCTLTEGRMVIKSLIEGSINGVGKLHKTAVFPCSIFQLYKGINEYPEDPNYDLFRLALKSTSLRLYPNYANCNWSGNIGFDENDPKTFFSTMGCRTANGFDINHDENQNPQLKDGRGNICPVTIIMPTLAMEAIEQFKDENASEDDIVDEFINILDTKIHEAKDMLIERYEWICSQPAESAKFMYENNTMYGYKPEESIRSALKHGTLAIGNLGLAETLELLVGCNHTTEKGMNLAKRIYALFKTDCANFKNEYKLNFGVYNSPECKNITSVGASTVM